MIWKMAWRNLWRHTRRTLITTASVAFGLWMVVTFLAIGEHSYSTTIDTGARMGSGHVTVQAEGYLESPSVDKRVAGAGALRALAAAQPGVEVAAERVQAQAVFSAGARSRGGLLLGVNPAQEGPENFYLSKLSRGVVFEGPDGEGLVLGAGLARRLGVGLGKKVVYTGTDVNGEVVSDVGRVVGIFETGISEVDGAVALVPLDKARGALGLGPAEASQVVVVLEEQRDAEAVRDALLPQVPAGAVALTWRGSMADLVGYIALDRAMNQFFQWVIGLLVAAGILNTLLMSVLERTREFGVMLALGTAPARLSGLIMAESALIGGVGLVMGAAITAPWCLYLYEVGLDMSAAMGDELTMNGVAFAPVLRYSLEPQALAWVGAALLGLTLLASLYPAWRAGRVPPLEALRVI